jgi:dipeptidyl aminopeptidase/acylaminoacyl peptidase
MHCESVAIHAHDGVSLRAWYYTPDQPNNKAIILFHGVGSNREDMVALGNLFLKDGYSVLEPDLRGHGESGGIATYGVLEGGDTSAWVDWLAKTGHWSGVYGFGASLGAAVLLESLEHETRFRAVVAESPYFDFRSVADERIARMLPAGTKWVAGPFVESGMIWARLRDGVDLRKASAADGLRVTATPVLLIHGLLDDRTSPDNSRRLAAMHPAAQLWLVPGSHHADAWAIARADFESRVLAWFRER